MSLRTKIDVLVIGIGKDGSFLIPASVFATFKDTTQKV